MLNALLLAAAIHGLFIVIGFFVKQKRRNKANRILIALLSLIILVLVSQLFYHSYGKSHPSYFYPVDVIIFLFGPMIFWYVREVFGKPVKRPFWILLPAILFLFSLVPYYLKDYSPENYPTLTTENPNLILDGNQFIDEPVDFGPYSIRMGDNFINFHAFALRIAGILLNLFFLVKTALVIRTFQRSLDAQVRREGRLIFLNVLFIAAALVFLFWVDDLRPYWGYEKLLEFTSQQNVWIALSLIIYLISFYATLSPDLFKLDAKAKVLVTRTVQKEMYDDLGKQILRTLRSKALFKNSQITLNDLALSLQMEKSKVSNAIKYGLNTNFYDLIARLRLDEFLQEATSGKNGHLTYEAIAVNCGFRSKSNFYKCFKEAYQMSPKQYLASQKPSE